MAENAIRVMCPNVACRKVMSVPIAARGKVVQCPQCRKRIRIPQSAGSSAADQTTSDNDTSVGKKAG